MERITQLERLSKLELHERIKGWAVMKVSRYGHCAHGRFEQTTREGVLVLAGGREAVVPVHGSWLS